MSRKKQPRTRRQVAKTVGVEIEGRFYQRAANGKLMVDGHQLNEAQERLFAKKIRERVENAQRPGSGIKDPTEYAHRVGLSDLLWAYRPRATATRNLLMLASDLGEATEAISSMRDFAFYRLDDTITDEGCRFIVALVAEAERRLARLRHYADSMNLERSTRLHHWTARAERLERI